MSNFGYFWNSRNGDRKYNAESMSDWLTRFFTNGVFNGELYVTATSGMTVSVSAGYACVGGKVIDFTDAQTFTLDTAYSSLSRVDTIVVERNDPDRTFYCKLIKGDTTGNPTPPVRTNGVYQLVLAQIAVGAGATQVTQANITDTRMDNTLCGYVTGTVEELPWSQITAQWETYYEEFKANEQADWTAWITQHEQDYADWTAAQKALWLAWISQNEAAFTAWQTAQELDFETWFNHYKDIIDDQTAAHLLNLIDANTANFANYYTKTQSDANYYAKADVFNKTQSDARYDFKSGWVNITISASSWNSSTNTYSFESLYPSATYDILEIIPRETTTKEQRSAWIEADCGGYYETNIIIAHGTLPTIDLPVKMLVRNKPS